MGRQSPLPLLILTAALTLAGCATPSPPPDPTHPTPTLPPEAQARVLHLTGAPGLSWDPPERADPQEVRGGSFFLNWGRASAYANFLGEPLEETLLLTGNATITFHARAEGPTLQGGVFPHFIAYFGTEHALPADGSGNAKAALAPNEEVEVLIPLALPRDGLLLPAGERPRVLLVAVMTQDDRAGDIAFLVNATRTPSRVHFEASPTEDPPTGEPTRQERHEGRLIGTAYAGAREGLSQTTLPIPIPPAASRVTLRLEAADAAGFADLDLTVLDHRGDEVARSVTPLGIDSVVLHPHQYPATGAAYAAVITNYGSATATYRLTTETYTNPPP